MDKNFLIINYKKILTILNITAAGLIFLMGWLELLGALYCVALLGLQYISYTVLSRKEVTTVTESIKFYYPSAILVLVFSYLLYNS